MKYAVLFIALLFAGCGGGSSTEEAPSADGGYETFTIDGKTIQVAKEDFPSTMNWEQAMAACQNHGHGWRLPTKEELLAMYEQLHKHGKGNFKDEWYWSSSQYKSDNGWAMGFGNDNAHNDGYDQAWAVNFGNDDAYNDGYGYKITSSQVRAVRALP